jgi:hypothetical protein
MNKLLPGFVLLTGITSAQAASLSMEKPAVRNERACWQAHAYLMERG